MQVTRKILTRAAANLFIYVFILIILIELLK